MQAKPQRHKPYGLLKQLLIPKHPWNSISMDFIETLLTSSGCDSILVIVDWLSKQGIFIPTTIHYTSKDLAMLFIMQVFSKHGVPNISPPTAALNLLPVFSALLEKHLTWTVLAIIWKVMDKLDGQIKLWNSTYGFSATISKIIGIPCFCLWNSPTITLWVLPPEYLHSSLTKAITHTLLSIPKET